VALKHAFDDGYYKFGLNIFQIILPFGVWVAGNHFIFSNVTVQKIYKKFKYVCSVFEEFYFTVA
jgi:hypothetical protein